MFGSSPRTVILHVVAETLLRDMVKSDIPHTPQEFATELFNYMDAIDAEAERRTKAREAANAAPTPTPEAAQPASPDLSRVREILSGALPVEVASKPVDGDSCECPACVVRRGLFGADVTQDAQKREHSASIPLRDRES